MTVDESEQHVHELEHSHLTVVIVCQICLFHLDELKFFSLLLMVSLVVKLRHEVVVKLSDQRVLSLLVSFYGYHFVGLEGQDVQLFIVFLLGA